MLTACIMKEWIFKIWSFALSMLMGGLKILLNFSNKYWSLRIMNCIDSFLHTFLFLSFRHFLTHKYALTPGWPEFLSPSVIQLTTYFANVSWLTCLKIKTAFPKWFPEVHRLHRIIVYGITLYKYFYIKISEH